MNKTSLRKSTLNMTLEAREKADQIEQVSFLTHSGHRAPYVGAQSFVPVWPSAIYVGAHSIII